MSPQNRFSLLVYHSNLSLDLARIHQQAKTGGEAGYLKRLTYGQEEFEVKDNAMVEAFVVYFTEEVDWLIVCCEDLVVVCRNCLGGYEEEY